MKFKKSIYKLLCFLLLSVLSLSLLTGCTQEDAEFAADVLTAVLETSMGEDVSEETADAVTKNGVPEEIITEDIESEETISKEQIIDASISEDGTYTTKEEVAEYLYLYGHLPSNFITKKEAKKLGWVSSEGNLDEVAPGMSIGGDYFGNYEGNLPEVDGRDYYECDIDFDGTYRNAKRIVYSNDGLIYYTEDHYESFELLYGEE